MLGEEIIANVNEVLEKVTSEQAELLDSNQANRRNSERRSELVQINLRPASSSMRHAEEIKAVCRDYTHCGCGITSQIAPKVGDVYRLEVPASTQHPLHSTFARCIRCVLIDEDLFEAGLSFLSRIELPGGTSSLEDISGELL